MKTVRFIPKVMENLDRLIVYEDITEWKKAEAALRRSEEKYRTILQSIEEGYYEVDLTGNLTFCNEAMAQQLGYPLDEVIGLNFHQYMDEDTAANVSETFSRVYQTGEPDRGSDWIFKKKNGERIWVETSVTLIMDLVGKAIGFRGMGKDVTARKQAEAELVRYRDHLEQLVAERTQELTAVNAHLSAEITERNRAEEALRESEERIRLIIGCAPDPMVVYDTDGKVSYLNPAFTKIFGWTLDELREQKINYVPAESWPGTLEMIERMKRGESVHSFETRRLTRSGETLDISISAALFHDRTGTLIGNVATLQDITERKQFQEELRRAKDKAEEATRAKGEFLARMSHEIRTPMNAIIGMCHLALQTELTAKQQDYLRKTKMAANTLLGIINDILDFSKIEAGKLDLEEVDFNLEEVLESLSNLVTQKSSEKGLELFFKTSPDVPYYLVGDPLRLGQVLTNLANNAVKFTESGEIIIYTELLKEETDQVTLRFSIKDTGIGLTQEQIDKLFQSFSQADGSTTRQYGGTGLGLSISQRLVELMGGRIWVSSQPGQGSTFFFTAEFKVPPGIAKAVAPDGPAQTGLMTVRAGQPAGIDLPAFLTPDFPGRILLVDDSVHNQFLMQAFLKKLPCRVDVAQDGKMAVEMVAGNQYDLVLLDVQMPIMDGYTATRTIRAWEQETGRDALPIIALTAHAFAEDVKKSLEAGYSDHLSKPIRKDKLIEVVCQYLRERVQVS
ncbi:MAG: PAS domain S-box protein, partial [Deltaproteobacteria bacterium]|nr:PAS domain S-box protein [Deltaproteobacteria bacterium]